MSATTRTRFSAKRMLYLLKRLKYLLQPQNLIAVAVLGVTLALFLWLQAATPYDLLSQAGLAQLSETLGWRGPFLYMLLIAIAVVVSQIPGVPLALAAGALWGPLPAGIYSVIGGFLGAMIAYTLGRTLGRSVVKVFAGKTLTFNDARGVWFIGGLIFVSRILPIFPFDIVSYAAGLSGLPVRIYSLVTFFGMIPSTFLLTYLGATFVIDSQAALALSGVAVLILVVSPFLIRRYNLAGLRDSISFD